MTSVSRDDWLTSEWLEADGLGGFASGSLASRHGDGDGGVSQSPLGKFAMT